MRHIHPTPTDGVRCSRCEQAVSLVDEHENCEQCVHDADCLAVRLGEFEECLQALVSVGLGEAEIHEAVALGLRGGAGQITGELPFRDPDPTWGGWRVESAFIPDPRDDVSEPNQIGHLRRASGISRTELAARCGVAQGDVALWEAGGLVPDAQKARLGRMFRVTVAFVIGEDSAGATRRGSNDGHVEGTTPSPLSHRH